MRNRIYAYAKKYKGDYRKIKQAIEDNEVYTMPVIDELFITRVDPLYPSCLFHLEQPPWILFYQGDIQLLHSRMIGIVGGREYSFEAEEITIALANELSKKYTIVSGMAKGIDGIAHRHALHSIGVLAHGLDYVYPKENADLYREMKQKQLLISEYPKGVMPKKYFFPFRNRIIAALSEKLIVPSCKEIGGTMVTVNEALHLNREIYTVPYSLHTAYAQGCNHLIEQGANMILSVKDIKDI